MNTSEIVQTCIGIAFELLLGFGKLLAKYLNLPKIC
jgi:hypothetical protein